MKEVSYVHSGRRERRALIDFYARQTLFRHRSRSSLGRHLIANSLCSLNPFIYMPASPRRKESTGTGNLSSAKKDSTKSNHKFLISPILNKSIRARYSTDKYGNHRENCKRGHYCKRQQLHSIHPLLYWYCSANPPNQLLSHSPTVSLLVFLILVFFGGIPML